MKSMSKQLVRRVTGMVTAALLLCTGCSGAGGTTPSSDTVGDTSTTSTVSTADSTTSSSTVSQTATTSGTTSKSGVKTTTGSQKEGSTMSTISTTTTTTKTSTTTTKRETEIRIVSCWGDSLTEGMSMPEGKSYPSILNSLLGTDYIVENSGDGGEGTTEIMARQGAIPVFTYKNITFAEGATRVLIGDGTNHGLVTADGTAVRFTAPLGRDISVNDLTINGKKYTISLDNFNWSDRSCQVFLSRSKADTAAVTITKGTQVKLASADVATTNHCDIYIMGANGGFDNDVNKLIEQYQKMIAHRGNDRYMIVAPYWRNDCTEALKAVFGEHLVDFVDYAKNGGLDAAGIKYRSRDNQSMKKGYAPPCLTLKGGEAYEDCHLNEDGYKVLATALYKRGQVLGFWK